MEAILDFSPRKTWRGEATTTEKRNDRESRVLARILAVDRDCPLIRSQSFSLERENAEKTEILRCLCPPYFVLCFVLCVSLRPLHLCVKSWKRQSGECAQQTGLDATSLIDTGFYVVLRGSAHNNRMNPIWVLRRI